MKSRLTILTLCIGLTACSPAPEYTEAANRYIEDVCPLAFGVDTTGNAWLPRIHSERLFSYRCPEENGVVEYKLKFSELPKKYYEKGNNDNG